MLAHHGDEVEPQHGQRVHAGFGAVDRLLYRPVREEPGKQYGLRYPRAPCNINYCLSLAFQT